MGIHDRDYYRESARGMFDSWGRWSVTTWLIVISCIAFVAQLVTRDLAVGGQRGALPPLEDFGIYDFDRLRSGEAWRLLTPLFLNVDLLALACSMFTIYWAGSRLEDRYGGREFLLFFLASGLFAYGVYFLTQIAGVLPPGFAIGPSPAIIAILVLFACHYPRERILLIFIPVPAWLLVVLYVGFAVFATGAGYRVPFSAYLAGALFGLMYFRFEWRISRLIPSFSFASRERAAPRLRVARSDPDELGDDSETVAAAVEAAPRNNEADEHFEAKVDRILEKVSKFGQESLTSEERELLFRASEVYKKRRK